MSIIDDIRKRFIRNTEVKEPDFNVTNFYQWENFNELTNNLNYLDQYFGWTYKARKVISDSLTSYPLTAYKGTDDNKVKVSERESRLLTDLKRFNSYQSLNEARRITSIHKGLTGVAYWYKTTSSVSGYKFEYYILDPTKMKVKTRPDGLPSHWIFTDVHGKEHKLELNEVIVFRDANPKNWLRGYGTLEASRLSHNSWQLASEFNMNVFGNMGRPEGILSIDGLGKDEREILERKLKDKYGGTQNAGKMAIMNVKPDWTDLTRSQNDLQFIEGMKLLREDILAMNGVPKPLVGLTDSTFTNSQEAQKVFQRYTIKPELELEADVINEQLVPMYAEKIEFIPDNPVEEDSDKITKNSVELFNAGIITKNEARARVGEEATDDGDEYKVEPQNPIAVNVENVEEEIKKVKKAIKQLSKEEQVTKDQRETLKKYFITKLDQQEKEFRDVAISYFDKQSSRVVASLEEKKQISLPFDKDAENIVGEMQFSNVYESLAVINWMEANRMTGGTGGVTSSVKRLIKKRLKYFVNEINSTTSNKLGELIQKAVNEGMGLDAVKTEVELLFNRWSYGAEDITEARSESIARTEVGAVANSTYKQNYAGNDLIDGYEWLATDDASTRPAHNQADGQIVLKGEKFNVGGEMLEYPCDDSGSAENTINCRCVILPHFKE